MIRTYKGPILLFAILLAVNTWSCKKLVDINAPYTSTNAANVYTNNSTAAAVLTGIYAGMSSSSFTSGGITSMSYFPGLSADELTLFGGSTNANIGFVAYYTNQLLNTTTPNFWTSIYKIIYVANSAIDGLNNPAISPNVQQQLTGEAKFVRAFCYFYLVNLYGDVPLVTTTNYSISESMARTPKAQVWQQIISDLVSAESLLNSNYVESDGVTVKASSERIRPIKWAAAALLARTYLYTGDYANAESQASLVISDSSLYGLSALNSAFLKDSREAIWQLQTVNPGYNTPDAGTFLLPAAGPSTTGAYPVYLSKTLVSSFETNDKRRANWIDSVIAKGTTYYYPYKYKVYAGASQEYIMVLRLAEQYLIRAEARAQQGKLTDATNDLNMIRQRAGLPNTTASSQQDILGAILHERQVELFTEWGHRWLDLKRTDSIDSVMNIVEPIKSGNSWNSNWQWYPVPISDIQKDAQLTQNTGY